MEAFLILFFVIVIILSIQAFFTVEQQSAYLIERFGKFVRVATPGLNIKIPFIERLRGYVSLRLMQLDVMVETKTSDNVFVKINVSVQYRILADKVYDAFYSLENAEGQIQSFVFDVVRAKVPKINLDDVFSKKDEIADSVKEELKEVMNQFGYDILKALVTDIDPDAKVKSAMNEINEAQRLRQAALERGEAEKIIKVKQAEGEAESKILQGKGLAGERREIVLGLKESLALLQEGHDSTSLTEVMNLILMSQYFDTLKEIGMNSKTNTILLQHSPSALGDIGEQIRQSIITGNLAAKD